MEAARTRKGILRYSPQWPSDYTPDPHTASSPLVSAGSTVIFPFYNITCTHAHRRTIQIQHVDLYDAYLLLFLIEILLSSGIRTQRYALKYARGFILPITRQ